MTSPFRNLLLSGVLIAIPAGGFTLAEVFISPTVQTASTQSAAGHSLGDLSGYMEIVRETQKIAATGDLIAAEHRITDLETLWDDSATALRKADLSAWNTVDAAADDAFSALRARTPDATAVADTLEQLMAALKAPVPGAATQPVQFVAGIAVTDATGRALPCEDLIGQMQDALTGTASTAAVADLQSRALERCNADDDARADAFAAQALSQIKG